MNIDIIKVPLFYGCDREGVEHGPKTLIESGLVELLERHCNTVRDRGFVTVPPMSGEDKYRSHPDLKYLDAVAETAENLARTAEQSFRDGYLPLTVGGDHSLALGTVAATSKANGNDIGIIWIDAHADINTTETSPSGNIHGMPLAASVGEGHEKLVNIYYKGQKVNPRNCFVLGARSVDDGEVEIIDRLGVNVWYMEEIREKGMGIVILELLELLEKRNIRDIHVSYDIDSLDASLVPGTGTPVADGLWFDESEKLIQGILDTGMVRSVDFVEFNPVRDREDMTLNASLRMLEAFARGLGECDFFKKQVKTA